jgi:hypothetical protein
VVINWIDMFDIIYDTFSYRPSPEGMEMTKYTIHTWLIKGHVQNTTQIEISDIEWFHLSATTSTNVSDSACRTPWNFSYILIRAILTKHSRLPCSLDKWKRNFRVDLFLCRKNSLLMSMLAIYWYAQRKSNKLIKSSTTSYKAISPEDRTNWLWNWMFLFV